MFNPLQMESLSAAMESLIPYPLFYRRHGVRRPVQLVAPTLSPIETLELPRNSILHFVSDDESLFGIPQDDFILRNEPRLVMVDHVTELADRKGPPRPTRLPAAQMWRDYHRKYRKTRPLLRPEMAMRDPRTLVVVNYALLPHLYRYTTSYFSSYFKWWNIQTTLWTKVGQLADTNRQQYIQCRLPAQLPSLAQLLKGELNTTRATLAAFTQPESLFLLEVWKWLGPNRQLSALAKATPQQLKNMNLIWVESGQWFVMNLGMLDEWRKPTRDEMEAGAEDVGIIDARLLQRRFLRLMMFLQDGRTVSTQDEPETVTKTIVKTDVPVDSDANVAPAEDVEMTVAKAVPLSVKVPATDSTRAKTIKLGVGLDVDSLPELHIEETEENILAIDEALSKDFEALDRLTKQIVFDDTEEDDVPPAVAAELPTPVINYQPKARTLSGGVMAKADALADVGMLSAAEYRRFTTLSTAFEKLPNPYGEGTLADQIVVDPKSLVISKTPQIPDSSTVLDKSMLRSSLFDFDSKYINNILTKDVARSVVALQHAGVAVTGYQIEEIEDALNRYEAHTVQLTPVQGKASTVHFRLPKVNEDGTFKANGVRYRLRKQRGDVPIRKLSSSKVALTSYYSKIFVGRSEKQIHNYSGWLTNQIAMMGMDPENQTVSSPMMSNVFDSNVRTPRIYSILATRFRSFFMGELEFFFDYHNRHKVLGEEAVRQAEGEGLVVIGRKGKNMLVVDASDVIYEAAGEELNIIGSIESLLGLSRGPIEMAEVKVFNKQLPVGMFLAYHLGLTQLINLLDVTPRRVPSGDRLNLSDDEYAIKFEDETLVFNKEHRRATLILSGLIAFENSTRNYPVHLFDKKDIYFNVLDQANIGVRYLREMELMVDLFVDPITEEILQSMEEPTDFIGLLLRSCELLETDWSPDETDMAYMRVKGYERMAGAVYSELTKALRLQRARGSVANARIELPPYAVWQAIQQDPAVKLVEESNPVHNLKEKEELTYSGTGGRSSRSMVRRTRVFHPNDMGVISEATKDSSDVAITTFLTADPNLLNLRGLTGLPKDSKMGSTSYLSTSALLAPAADHDDPKRVNFISIQQSASTFAKGYRPTPLRTGYEQVMAHRVDDLFAYTAKAKGTITQVTPRAVTVTYEDGTVKALEIGRRFGTAAGLMLPHAVQSAVKEGDVVEEGDIITFNTHYFEQDPLYPKQVLWKAGVLVKTAILESTDTLEDSSAISERTAKLLETQLTKVRDIVVKFDQSLHNLVQPGTEVDVESILCTIEDAVTAQNNLFDSDSLDTLRLLSANTPKAKFKGVVEKIEVLYHGDVDDLSPSLQEVATLSDRNRRREAKDLKTTFTSGRVDDSMRIDGNSLPFESAVIRIYITGPMSAGVGDKGVFANQMKTIFGRVMSGVNETDSGETIDAIFGYQSISDRIVLSPERIGTTNTLLKIISKRVADVYRG